MTPVYRNARMFFHVRVQEGRIPPNRDRTMAKAHMITIKLTLLNIDGLKSKLANSDFLKYVLTKDIISLVETWIPDIEKIDFSHFVDYISFSALARKAHRFGRA